MRTIGRIRLTWTFAILYGFVSAMGEGLHALPGQGHDACCQHFDSCHDDGCDDCATAIEPVGAFPQGEIAVGSSPTLLEYCHCSICDFLAQGTWFSRPIAILNWRFFRGFQRPVKAIFVVARLDHLPFLSRAPPVPVDCWS